MSAATPFTLRPYQQDAVDFLAPRNAALLGADPGLGKSLSAYMAAAKIGADRVLVLCPAIARASWQAEHRKWGWTLPINAPVKPADIDSNPLSLTVLSYGQMARPMWLRALLKADAWDVLILDEAHRLKEKTTACTRGIYGRSIAGGSSSVIGRARTVWLLTGTPAPNAFSEVWTHLHALAPARIIDPNGANPMPFKAFQAHVSVMAQGDYGLRAVGNRNGAWLAERLEGFMLRQRKADVARDMPPMAWVDVPLEIKPRELMRALRAVSLADDVVVRILTATLKGADELRSIQNQTHIASARRLIGLHKAHPALEWIKEQLDAGMAKVVVFAIHRGALNVLADGLAPYGVTRVDGSTSQDARARAVDKFQSDPNTRVFVGQMLAAGTAITLTAASDVVLVEQSWTPSDNFQAAMRVHRLGQLAGVVIHVLHARGTLDARVAEVVRRKSAELAEVFS